MPICLHTVYSCLCKGEELLTETVGLKAENIYFLKSSLPTGIDIYLPVL